MKAPLHLRSKAIEEKTQAGLLKCVNTQRLPSELLDDAVLLEELSGRACHGQDIISDPADGRRDW